MTTARARESRFEVLAEQVRYPAFTLRTIKAAQWLGIRLVGELVQRKPDELLTVKNFGTTSLKTLRATLRSRGLDLGMAFAPDEIEHVADQRRKLDGHAVPDSLD